MYGMTTAGARRLGEAVHARRTQLGLAQSDLRGRGGPGQVVVGQIERGQQKNPQSLTLSRLDTALGWASGTARRIFKGEIPGPLLESDESRLLSGAGLDPTVPVPTDVLREMVRQQEETNRTLRDLRDRLARLEHQQPEGDSP